MKQVHVPHCLAVALAVQFLLAGCSHPPMVSRPAYFSAARTQLQAGLSPQEERRVRTHCVFGMPKLDAQWNFGPTDVVARDGYVLQHSATDKIPLWVAERIVTQQLTGSEEREDKFLPDPELKRGRRAELADYARSGFDRGHQAPAGNQTTDARLKAETFYLSNMAPQVGAGFNRAIWKELEELVRDWIEQRGEGYIYTGGMFYDPKEEDRDTASGVVNNRVIGRNSVAVPTHFYKIVLAKDAAGKWQSIAFVMENKRHARPYKFHDHIKSVDWVEDRTGINFFPELDALEERRLERTPSPLWN